MGKEDSAAYATMALTSASDRGRTIASGLEAFPLMYKALKLANSALDGVEMRRPGTTFGSPARFGASFAMLEVDWSAILVGWLQSNARVASARSQPRGHIYRACC